MALISIIIPCYNEEGNIKPFFKHLSSVLKNDGVNNYELIYVNDGSKDNTLVELNKLSREHKLVRVINLSRNFGKEIATTAGIHQSKGDAVIMIDADGQHPPELIAEFIRRWRNGAKVVVGVRKSNQKEGIVKKYGSKLFYMLFNSMTESTLTPGATDFRLIDKVVKNEFMRMTERNRITRGLIDWLGFNQEFVYFVANARTIGEASYSTSKLIKLALNSFISLSLKPLYFSAYAGAIILPLVVLLIIFSIVETIIGDPMHLNITGSAYIGMVTLFLVGVILLSQGIVALYLSRIHTETQNRPLFVINDNSGAKAEKD